MSLEGALLVLYLMHVALWRKITLHLVFAVFKPVLMHFFAKLRTLVNIVLLLSWLFSSPVLISVKSNTFSVSLLYEIYHNVRNKVIK